jgi:hypothetical protein
MEVQLHAFLTSALDVRERSTSRLRHFAPGKRTPEPILRGFIQKFSDSVDNEMYAYLRYYSLLSSSKYFPSELGNGSSVSVTAGSIAGTDFLESRVGWSAIVPEFQWHAENDALLASISFSETRSLKGPNQASKEGGGPQPCF